MLVTASRFTLSTMTLLTELPMIQFQVEINKILQSHTRELHVQTRYNDRR